MLGYLHMKVMKGLVRRFQHGHDERKKKGGLRVSLCLLFILYKAIFAHLYFPKRDLRD